MKKKVILFSAFVLVLAGTLWCISPGSIRIEDSTSVFVSVAGEGKAEKVSDQSTAAVRKLLAQAKYCRIPFGRGTTYSEQAGAVIVTIKNEGREPVNLYFVPGNPEPWFYSANGFEFKLRGGETLYQEILESLQ